MPKMLCTEGIFCPGSDFPIANFSAESPDNILFESIAFVYVPPRLNHTFTAVGCVSECESSISQDDADQCAVRQAYACVIDHQTPDNPNNPTPGIVCNNPQTSSATCPDGNIFTWTVPAGLFCGNSQTSVDEQAKQYATEQANLRKICLGALQRCCCINQTYSSRITVQAIVPVIMTVVAGALPPGLGMDSFGLVSGTPTQSGTYSFLVEADSAGSGFMRKSFTITVLEIATSALPTYTIGTPYSYQLVAAGGSGNYNWAITSGSLPDGLTMSLTGLISGTPTGLNSGVQPIGFKVIDVTCEQADQSFFPPQIQMIAKSTTTIATLYGYSEYIASNPPKKYHTLTWQGTSEQTARMFGVTTQIAGAKYVWSGAGSVDGKGNQLSNYRKDFYAVCPKLSPWPTVTSVPNFGLTSLVGYCWPPDPQSCPACNFDDTTWGFVANVATNNLLDTAQNGFNNFLLDQSFRVVTPTSLDDSGTSSSQTVFIGQTENLPSNQVQITSANAYKSLLSDEYTDAEALANAVVIVSNGSTAENFPRTTGFVSRTTSVLFTLLMTNLIDKSAYTVSVQFRDQHFVLTTKQYGVVASGTTASITDTVPTPGAGGTITVLNPKIVFVP